MKCLPASKLAEANGVAIHDWHAEVLAIRTFNRHLLDECQSIVDGSHDVSGAILQRIEGSTEEYTTHFRVRDDVKLHMYCSEAPCKLFSLLLYFMSSSKPSYNLKIRFLSDMITSYR